MYAGWRICFASMGAKTPTCGERRGRDVNAGVFNKVLRTYSGVHEYETVLFRSYWGIVGYVL